MPALPGSSSGPGQEGNRRFAFPDARDAAVADLGRRLRAVG